MDIKDLIKDVVIQCETKDEAKRILGMVHDHGYRWVSGDSIIGHDNWEIYKKLTCYYIRKNVVGYASTIYYKREGFEIMSSYDISDHEEEWEDITNEINI